jgi:chaperonin GroES
MYKPTWSEYEKDMHSDSPEMQRKATDAFLDTRVKETAISRKAKDWEADRKKDWVKAKPKWAKQRVEAEQQADPSVQLVKEIKSGGSHAHGLQPARGYLLIQMEQQESQTEGGLFLAEGGLAEPNTAVVLAVGDDLILDKHILPAPVKSGAKVLLKKFAGMEITLKGEQCRLVQFTDVLGELI